jgi:hypothetical protein
MKRQHRHRDHGDDHDQRHRLEQDCDKESRRAWIDFFLILGGATPQGRKLVKKRNQREDR